MTKEILKDEILKEEQLDQVAGGTVAESYDDADRFEALGVHVYCNDPGVPLNDLYTETMMTLQDTYQKFGVRAMNYGDDHRANRYFVDGKEVSREDAWKHIYAQFGK